MYLIGIALGVVQMAQERRNPPFLALTLALPRGLSALTTAQTPAIITLFSARAAHTDANELRNKLTPLAPARSVALALAQVVGVSRNTISSIETGQYSPTARLALILCIALDVTFEDMFYFE